MAFLLADISVVFAFVYDFYIGGRTAAGAFQIGNAQQNKVTLSFIGNVNIVQHPIVRKQVVRCAVRTDLHHFAHAMEVDIKFTTFLLFQLTVLLMNASSTHVALVIIPAAECIDSHAPAPTRGVNELIVAYIDAHVRNPSAAARPEEDEVALLQLAARDGSPYFGLCCRIVRQTFA